MEKTALLKKCPYSELLWSAFSLIWTEYSVHLRIQSECGKIRTRITPNTDIFHALQLKAVRYFYFLISKNKIDRFPEKL